MVAKATCENKSLLPETFAGENMEEQELLQKMRHVYANLESYSDVGTVESPDSPGPGLEFQTFFKRPLNFRFHWLSWHPYFGKALPADENTIWTDGQSFNSNYYGKPKQHNSLSMMLAGATGVSRGAVHHLFNMIVPDSLKMTHFWHEMTELRSLPDDMVESVDCFHMIGTAKHGVKTELWLDKSRFVVRRIEEINVITEEMSAKIFAERQSDGRLEKVKTMGKDAGLTDEMMEHALAHMAKPIRPRTYRHIYNYSTVAIDENIDDAVFTS